MFYEILTAITSSVSVLQESILISQLVSRKVAHPSLLLETSQHLSFVPNLNVGTGLAVKLLLTGMRISEVKETLPTLTDVCGDLAQGYAFWKAMRSMHEIMI